MIKIQVDNVKEYIIAKAMIESFTDSEKLFYNLSTDFLLIKDEGVEVVRSDKYYEGENGIKSQVVEEMWWNYSLGGLRNDFKDNFEFLTTHKDMYDIKLRCKKADKSTDSWKDLIKAMDETDYDMED